MVDAVEDAGEADPVGHRPHGPVAPASAARIDGKSCARSRRTSVIATTVVLTLVSFLPSVTADTDTATSVVLCLSHVVAAAIVIPMLASRLPDRRPAR